MTVAAKACLECGTKFSGRVDKKFCCDPCRITYNNRLNSAETNQVRNINHILNRNRRVLLELNTTGKSRVTRSKLLEKGFDFTYLTSIYTTKEGTVYYYCYEQGYTTSDKAWYLLVKKDREKEKQI